MTLSKYDHRGIKKFIRRTGKQFTVVEYYYL